MSQILGPSRMGAQFSTAPDADASLVNTLTLYKAPATIRDMKQVFFYTHILADISMVHPLRIIFDSDVANAYGNINAISTGTDNIDPKYTKVPWYLPLGTTRRLNITEKINDLMDIRVPKDKYVIEINLAECNIESDPTNWLKIPDYVVQNKIDFPSGALSNPREFYTKPTYTYNVEYGDAGANPTPPGNNLAIGRQDLIGAKFWQATKQSQPESLFVRIRELCNNEPYNWSVTSTGAYSVDKNHQLVVRHGDINMANLTLEFGHVVCQGRDLEYERSKESFTDAMEGSLPDSIRDPSEFRQQPSIDKYDTYKYLDYNSEAYNVFGRTNPTGDLYKSRYQWAENSYPTYYKSGYYSIDSRRDGDTLEQPINRPPFILAKDAVQKLGGLLPDANQDYLGADWQQLAPLIQGIPLKYNQQVRAISFRFLVRIIHMF